MIIVDKINLVQKSFRNNHKSRQTSNLKTPILQIVSVIKSIDPYWNSFKLWLLRRSNERVKDISLESQLISFHRTYRLQLDTKPKEPIGKVSLYCFPIAKQQAIIYIYREESYCRPCQGRVQAAPLLC